MYDLQSRGQAMYGPSLPYSEHLHATKYRGDNESFDDYCIRYARTTSDDEQHFRHLLDALRHQRILPAGRQQLAVGRPYDITAMNCYVGDTIPDTSEGIMDALKYSMLTLRSGGGCGWDFSTLRPHGDPIRGLGIKAYSTGPVSFMGCWDAMCLTVLSAGHRRGAMMGVLRVDHPDIMRFINAKQNQKTLANFNISVAVTDEFMSALAGDTTYSLVFGGRTYDKVRAVDVWARIMERNWDWAEPGVLFIDRINQMNPLYYCEEIAATNPCFAGETLVWTENGPERFDVITDIAEFGDSVSVLTQLNNGELVYRKMVHPRRTKKDSQLVGVALRGSAATTVYCTPEHEFFLRDGSRCQAKNLYSRTPMTCVVPKTSGPSGYSTMAISVHDVPTQEDVYCGTVEETGKFFIYTGENEGTLVANCGEQPLPPNGACLLGSLNIVKYLIKGLRKIEDGVLSAGAGHYIDYDLLALDTAVACRAFDNVIDCTRYPLEKQREEQQNKRRMGIGVTGMANALEIMGYRYASEQYITEQERILALIRDTAYNTSISAAKRLGSFPLFDAKKWLASGFGKTLPREIRTRIKKEGLRNGLLLSIAPTGTISMCADNVSSGIEPPYQISGKRLVHMPEGQVEVRLEDFASKNYGVKCLTASEVSAGDHIRVLCSAQKFVDSAVSKTCNVRGAIRGKKVDGQVSFDDFKALYLQAYKGGAKGCTTFNVNGKKFGIFIPEETEAGEAGCNTDPMSGARSCDI